MEKINAEKHIKIIDELNEREWDGIKNNFSKTKVLLPYSFLWSTTDYFSPHGNDTGFDVLALFIDWNKKNLNVPISKFLKILFRDWGIDIQKMKNEDYTAYMSMTYFQSVVSLSIAVIKVRGIVDSELSIIAINALDNYSEDIKQDIKQEVKWEYLKECQSKIMLIKEVLEKNIIRG